MENTGTDKIDGILKGEHQVNIYYEDTDFSGYVYHANYLKYFERAREHIFGLNYLKELFKEDFQFVVSSMEVDYHLPASHGDSLTIYSEAKYSSSPLMEFKQKAIKLIDNKPVDIVSAKIKVVAINQRGRPTRIPQKTLEKFQKLGTANEK